MMPDEFERLKVQKVENKQAFRSDLRSRIPVLWLTTSTTYDSFDRYHFWQGFTYPRHLHIACTRATDGMVGIQSDSRVFV
jgi:hypothetical protein